MEIKDTIGYLRLLGGLSIGFVALFLLLLILRNLFYLQHLPANEQVIVLPLDGYSFLQQGFLAFFLVIVTSFGVGILFLKEWARHFGVVLSLIGMVYGIGIMFISPFNSGLNVMMISIGSSIALILLSSKEAKAICNGPPPVTEEHVPEFTSLNLKNFDK
jgi:hypothetical protein